MNKIEKIRTRYAPSPTGYMHIGNLRTALYSYLFAKHYDGDFVLRIEDTDQKRYVDGAVDVIYKTLKDTKLIHDEGPDIGGEYGPYTQSERKHIYKKHADQLLANGTAYYCFCDKDSEQDSESDESELEQTYGHHCNCSKLTKEEIEANLANNKPYVIRQNIPQNMMVTFHDEVYGDITVDSNTLDHQVLIKGDGLPTYNFANVIDDHLMNITHILRGKEYISSTPKYQLLYEAFGWQPPKTMHLSTINGKNEDGSVSKLSKRHGSTSFAQLIDAGYLPEALINYIALLGWSPKQEREIYSLQELVELFNVEGLVKTDAIFDYQKLAWMNGEYIKVLPREKFLELSQKFLEGTPECVHNNWEYASTLAQSRINTFADIKNLFAFLDNYGDFDLTLFENKKNKLTQEISKNILIDLLPQFEALSEWTPENINKIATEYATAHGLKLGAVMWPPRIAVTGNTVTPGGVGEMMYLVGKDSSITRIKHCIERL